MANGNIIGIINSDDWYEPDALEVINKKYNELNNPNTIIYGLLRQYKNNALYQIKCNCHEFVNDKMIPHPTCFVPKSIYDKYGVFSMDYKIVSDYELMLRYSQKEDISFCLLEHVIANFRIGGASNGYKALLETIKLKKNYKILSRKKEILLRIKALYLKLFK